MNRILSREDKQIINRHMKRCSASLATREIQTQIRMRDTYNGYNKKNQIIINVVKDVEKSQYHTFVVECDLMQSLGKLSDGASKS